MKFIKSDDQTLSTIARLATVEPCLAKEFALKSRFYDDTVAQQTRDFWQRMEGNITIENLTERVKNIDFNQSDMAEKIRTELCS